MADVTLKGMEVADVYAGALFELARQANRVDEIRAQLEELVGLQERDPALAAFLAARAVDEDARARSLDRILRGRIDDLLLNTLQVMNRHGRADSLPALLRTFILRIEDARGQIEIQATSAVELTPEQRTAVTVLAEELAGKKPLVEFRVDPDLIGGLVLQIGDQRLDNSVRWHLRTARRRLLERSARGLGRNVVDDRISAPSGQ